MTKPQTDGYKVQHTAPESPPYTEHADMAQPVQRPVATNGSLPDSPQRDRNNSTGVKAPPPINESVTHSLSESQVSGVSPSLIATITQQVLKEIEARKQPNTYIPPHFYPPPPPPNAPLSPTASVHSQSVPQREVFTPPSPQKQSEFVGDSPPPARPVQRLPDDRVRSRSASSQSSSSRDSRRASTHEPDGARPTTVKEEDSGETTLEKIWGKLFNEDGKPTEKLGQLLRGMADYMIESYEPKNSLVVTPEKMQRYYRETHISNEPYPWHTIFDDSVSCISRMYRELGCEHHLVQEPNEFHEKPDIPGLTARGFQHWATMMVLAHPDAAFQRLCRIVKEFPINNPDLRNERFPKELPRRLFPQEPNLRIRDILIDAIEEHARVSIDHSGPSDTPRQFASTQSTPAPPTQQQPPPPMQQQQQPPPPPPEIHRPTSPSHQSEAASVASETSMSSSIERERKPYNSSNLPPSCSVDDTNPTPTQSSSQPPIERSRKPYTAREGEGRSFEVPHTATAPPTEDARPAPPPMSNNVPPAPRQSSNATPQPTPSIRRANSSASSRPVNIPSSGSGAPRQRGEHAPPPLAASATFSTNSQGRPNYSHRGSVSGGRRRAYSPPPGAPFRASESDVTSHSSMGGSFGDSHSWDGRDDGRRFEYRERDDGGLPPPPIGRPRDHGRGASPGRRTSTYAADEDYYRPRRETTSQRTPW